MDSEASQLPSKGPMLGYVRIGYGLTARIGVYDFAFRTAHTSACNISLVAGKIPFSLPRKYCYFLVYNMHDMSCG